MSIADKGQRVGNFVFDSFCILLLLIVFIFLDAIVSNYVEYDSSGVLDFAFVGLYFGYYFVFELVLNKTLGKYLTKTSVVNINGQKPSVKDLLFRTICRLIPVDIFSFVFGTGFHDNFSNTTVISSPEKTVTNESH